MKKELTIQLSQKFNQKTLIHKKATSNYGIKPSLNKIPSYKKINHINNKPSIIPNNKIKIKNNNQKNITRVITDNLKEANNKKKKLSIIKTNNNMNDKRSCKENLNKLNINVDTKTIQQSDINIKSDIKIKKFQNTINFSKKKIIGKRNRKCTLIKINNRSNQEIININKHRNDIDTNILFKNNQSNSRESINKSSKKGKNVVVNYIVNCKVNNKLTIENTFNNNISNSNNNVNKINKNNTSTSIQLQKIFNSTSQNNSEVIQNINIGKSQNGYKSPNINCFENSSLKNNDMRKKYPKLNNSGSLYYNNVLTNSNYLLPTPNILTKSLKNYSSSNYLKNSHKTIDSTNLKKIGKYYLKKKLNTKTNPDENPRKEQNLLKRFKTEKEIELVEIDKNMYQLIHKKKKKIYLDNKTNRLNKIKSFELKKNENLKNIYQNLEQTIEDIGKYIEVNGTLYSPIKSKDKKISDNYLYLNDMLNKKKRFLTRSKEKAFDDISNKKVKNKSIININKKISKKDKKHLSIQIETKYIYQKNNNIQNDNHKKILTDKNINNNKIENNNIDLFNSIKIYKTIQLNPFDYSNYTRNHITDSKNDLNYTKKLNNNNFISVNKKNYGSIDFDIIKNQSKKKVIINKEQIFKKKRFNSNNKIKINEVIKIKDIYKNRKNDYFSKNNCNKERKIKINDNENNSEKEEKEITYINDSFFDEHQDEETLVIDSNQSTSNITKINSKFQNHFINILKHRNNSKLESYLKISISITSLLQDQKIVKNIISFCNYKTLNKLCLLNKEHYKYLKPFINEKIKLKIININKNNIKNNIIKKSILMHTPLSKLSPVMIQKKYMDLLYEVNEKYDVEIKKDLLRTLPYDNSFQYGNENYNKLYHILSAYSNYNKNIGYAQGINFLAGHCLYIFNNEIDAFIFLDALIQKFKLENLIGIKNNELNKKLNKIECFVNKWCPEVNKHLQKIFLNYDFFTCKWMITLFSNNMNPKYLFQLWDYMIIFGWKFFKCFVIAIIKFNENKILNSSLETITKIMNDILKTKEFENNFNNIINFTFQYLNKEEEIV